MTAEKVKGFSPENALVGLVGSEKLKPSKLRHEMAQALLGCLVNAGKDLELMKLFKDPDGSDGWIEGGLEKMAS